MLFRLTPLFTPIIIPTSFHRLSSLLKWERKGASPAGHSSTLLSLSVVLYICLILSLTLPSLCYPSCLPAVRSEGREVSPAGASHPYSTSYDLSIVHKLCISHLLSYSSLPLPTVFPSLPAWKEGNNHQLALHIPRCRLSVIPSGRNPCFWVILSTYQLINCLILLSPSTICKSL